MQFFHKTGTIRLRDVCSHTGLRPSALVQMLPFLAHLVWGGQAGRDGGGGQRSPPEHALATMMMCNLPAQHPQGVRARSRLRLFLLSLSSYKRAGWDCLLRPMGAHAPPRERQHCLSHLFISIPYVPKPQQNQSCSALETLGESRPGWPPPLEESTQGLKAVRVQPCPAERLTALPLCVWAQSVSHVHAAPAC